jgi:hypothetical protein
VSGVGLRADGHGLQGGQQGGQELTLFRIGNCADEKSSLLNFHAMTIPLRNPTPVPTSQRSLISNPGFLQFDHYVVRRNCLAGHQPAVLLFQTQVRAARAIGIIQSN